MSSESFEGLLLRIEFAVVSVMGVVGMGLAGWFFS
jgi:hypothetical protein